MCPSIVLNSPSLIGLRFGGSGGLDGTECLCSLVFELLVECVALSDGWDVVA